MTFDTPLQTYVSFAALLVWSWWLIRPPIGTPRWPLAVIWVATMLYSISSLTYLDALPTGTPSGINFAARIFLLVAGIAVPVIAYGKHPERTSLTIDEVWAWPSVIAGSIAAVIFGLYFVHVHVARPAWNGRSLWATVGVDALFGTFLFSASQVFAAWYMGDAGWVRIMSRYGMWVVFSLVLAATVWAGVTWRHHKGHE